MRFKHQFSLDLYSHAIIKHLSFQDKLHVVVTIQFLEEERNQTDIVSIKCQSARTGLVTSLIFDLIYERNVATKYISGNTNSNNLAS